MEKREKERERDGNKDRGRKQSKYCVHQISCENVSALGLKRWLPAVL